MSAVVILECFISVGDVGRYIFFLLDGRQVDG